MTEDIRRLADIATGQHGAITATPSATPRISVSGLRRRVQSGVLERVGAHTYRSPFVPDLAARRPRGARARLRPADTFVSGPSAAALHGFDGFRLKPPFHVTVLRGRNVQRAHHRIHTTTELPLIDRATVERLPAMSATRTLIDVARFVARRDVSRPPSTPRCATGLDRPRSSLHRRIVALRSSGRYGIPKLLAVIEGAEVTRGGHSWLERRFLELCAQLALPRPITQQVADAAKDRLVRVDCRFPGTRVVVEVLGYRWHRPPSSWLGTRRGSTRSCSTASRRCSSPTTRSPSTPTG